MPRSALGARKPIAALVADAADSDGPALARNLSAFSLVCIGVGATVGAGIFVLTGTAAANYAGPGLMLSFVLGAVASGLVALCYAELAAMIPVAGSTYSYTYVTLGALPAWIIGWDLVLEFAMAAATIAVGWSGYAQSLLADAGLRLPAWLAAGRGGRDREPSGGARRAGAHRPADARQPGGGPHQCRAGGAEGRDHPRLPRPRRGASAARTVAAAGAAERRHVRRLRLERHLSRGGVVFFAYVGFETISTAAGETRNPQRDAPVGLIGSLLVTAALYVAVAAVLTGLVPYRDLDVADPIARAMAVTGLTGFPRRSRRAR